MRAGHASFAEKMQVLCNQPSAFSRTDVEGIAGWQGRVRIGDIEEAGSSDVVEECGRRGMCNKHRAARTESHVESVVRIKLSRSLPQMTTARQQTRRELAGTLKPPRHT